MSAGDSNYTVGRGKPPLHTRFQKGQSGNPSGKPGPARLARQRFQRALHAALDAETVDLKDARPRVNLEAMVRRLMLDAAGGDRGAMKLILSELDHEIAREEPDGGSMTEEAEQESGEQGAGEPPPLPDYARWQKANQGE
jgi:hypothetical protein